LLLFVIYLRRKRGVEGATVDSLKCSSGQELVGGGGYIDGELHTQTECIDSNQKTVPVSRD
jgi:hypothetical protein